MRKGQMMLTTVETVMRRQCPDSSGEGWMQQALLLPDSAQPEFRVSLYNMT